MKEIGWPAPCGYTIFCDDMRQEIGNKPSYMGVYAGRLFMPGPFPLALPKFVCAVHYFERPDELVSPLELRIFLPGDAEDAPSHRVNVPIPMQRPDENFVGLGDDPRLGVIIPVMFAPFPLATPGRLKVRMARGTDEIIRLGALSIEIGPAAQVFAPPANQDTPPPT